MSDLSTNLHEIRSAIRDCFETNKEPLTMAQTKAWVSDKYPNRFDPQVVHSQVRGSCHNLERAWTRKDRKDAPKILLYDKDSMVYQLRTSVEEVVRASPSPNGPLDSSTAFKKRIDEQVTFVLERHLRDYLVRNLHVLENGLELYDGNISSVEYCVNGRFIDILARDTVGVPVIIELKVKKAYDRVVGQALLYRSLIETKLEVDRVRIILVGAKISKELKLATKHIPDLHLFEYELSPQLTRVE